VNLRIQQDGIPALNISLVRLLTMHQCYKCVRDYNRVRGQKIREDANIVRKNLQGNPLGTFGQGTSLIPQNIGFQPLQPDHEFYGNNLPPINGSIHDSNGNIGAIHGNVTLVGPSNFIPNLSENNLMDGDHTKRVADQEKEIQVLREELDTLKFNYGGIAGIHLDMEKKIEELINNNKMFSETFEKHVKREVDKRFGVNNEIIGQYVAKMVNDQLAARGIIQQPNHVQNTI
jgi:hypothetical protein